MGQQAFDVCEERECFDIDDDGFLTRQQRVQLVMLATELGAQNHPRSARAGLVGHLVAHLSLAEETRSLAEETRRRRVVVRAVARRCPRSSR